MNNEKHIPLQELVDQLQAGVSDIDAGNMSNDDVMSLHDKAREFYERLTVLRFKAFEVYSTRVEETEEEAARSQINLIDAIAEVSTQVIPKTSTKVRSESLVEKHLSKPLSSVGEGLTIIERANFTSVLFSNDDSSFNDMLDAVDECGSFEEATEVFEKSIKPIGAKEDVDLAFSSFQKRIPRLFSTL